MIAKFYTAKYDRVFKSIFCSENNYDLLKELLKRILNKNIINVKLLRNELDVQNKKDKVKTVDVLVLVDDEYLHIEINTVANDYIHVRNFNYFTSIYNKKTIRGGKYDLNHQSIHIDLSYNLKKSIPIKQEYEMQTKDGNKYIDNIKIIEYNMDLLKDQWLKNSDIAKKYGHLIMLDLNKDQLKKLVKSKGDWFMKKYQDEVVKINDEEYFQSYMTREEDQLVCFNTEKAIAYDNGQEKSKIQIVKNMLKEKLNINLISKVTGLSNQEIDNIAKNLVK